MAEVALDAIAEVTAVPTQFKTKDPTVEGDRALPFPAGWRAVQLPDAGTDSYFTKAFGRAARELTCECERTVEPSVTQALHLSNGDTIQTKLVAKESALSRGLAGQKTNTELIDAAYLAAFARFPSESERPSLEKLFTDPGIDRRTALEDLYWALLTSREFLFNH